MIGLDTLAIALVRLVGLIPLSLRALLGRALGNIISFIPSRERTIAELQLSYMLEDRDSSGITKGVYANITQTLLESLNLSPYLETPERYIECKDKEYIEELIAQKKPVIALTAHTANWDLLAGYMIQLGVPLSTIGRKARRKSLQSVLEYIRDGYGIRTLWRNSSDGSKALIKELKDSRTIAALIDQDTRVSSIFSPLLKLPARTPSGIIALGKRYNAEIVSAFIIRTGFLRYKIEVKPFPSELSIEEIVAQYNVRLGAILKKHPEQWVWFHKRWRSQPEKGTMSSKEYIRFLEEKLKEKLCSENHA